MGLDTSQITHGARDRGDWTDPHGPLSHKIDELASKTATKSAPDDEVLIRADGTKGKTQGSTVVLSDVGSMTEVRAITGETALNFTVRAAGLGGNNLNVDGGTGSASGNAGDLVASGGIGGTTSGDGGDFTGIGGTCFDGAGGSANLTGKNGVGSNNNGGNAVLTPGNATGSGTDGIVLVRDRMAFTSSDEGNTGRLNRQVTREVHTLAASSPSDTTTLAIPSGARLLTAQMNVNVAVTDFSGDDTWSARFLTGSSTTIVTGAAAAQNTKVDFIVPDDEKTTAVTEVRFDANGGAFTAGVIEVVCWFESLTSLADV